MLMEEKRKLVAEYFPEHAADPINLQHIVNIATDYANKNKIEFEEVLKDGATFLTLILTNEDVRPRAICSAGTFYTKENGERVRIDHSKVMEKGINHSTQIMSKEGVGYLKYTFPTYMNNLELIMTKLLKSLNVKVPEIEPVVVTAGREDTTAVLSHEMPNFICFTDLYLYAKKYAGQGYAIDKSAAAWRRVLEFDKTHKERILENDVGSIFVRTANLLIASKFKMGEVSSIMKDFGRTVFYGAVVNQLDMHGSNLGINGTTREVNMIDNSWGYVYNERTHESNFKKMNNINFLRRYVTKTSLIRYLMTSEFFKDSIQEEAKYVIEHENEILNTLDDLVDRYGEGILPITLYKDIVRENIGLVRKYSKEKEQKDIISNISKIK